MSFFQVGLSPSSFIKGDFTAGTIVTLRRSYSICYFPASAWLKQRDKKESLLESAHNLHWTCCRLFCSTSCDRLSSFPGIVLRLPLSLSLSGAILSIEEECACKKCSGRVLLVHLYHATTSHIPLLSDCLEREEEALLYSCGARRVIDGDKKSERVRYSSFGFSNCC